MALPANLRQNHGNPVFLQFLSDTSRMITDDIENGNLAGILFSSESCSICHSLYEQIEAIFPERFPLLKIQRIKIEEYPELRGKYMVFSVPTFLIFFDNKELIRKAGVFGIQEVIQPLERYYEMITT